MKAFRKSASPAGDCRVKIESAIKIGSGVNSTAGEYQCEKKSRIMSKLEPSQEIAESRCIKPDPMPEIAVSQCIEVNPLQEMAESQYIKPDPMSEIAVSQCIEVNPLQEMAESTIYQKPDPMSGDCRVHNVSK